MFIGEFRHSIDPKGRIAIPAKFRGSISGGAIVTRGIDHCLFVFTLADWEKLAQKLVNLPLAQANSRAFVRLMLSGAADVEVDSQGRVLIPDYLRKYAGLDKDAVVCGVYNRMEIWNASAWEEYRTKTEGSSEEIAEKLGELGI